MKVIFRLHFFTLFLLGFASFVMIGNVSAQPTLLTNLFVFSQHNATNSGGNPIGNLILGRDNALYGVTVFGGANNLGAIFRVNADGTGETLLHSFTTNEGGGSLSFGGTKYISVMQASDDALYGTISGSSDNGSSAIFKLFPDGSGYTLIHSFTSDDPVPVSLIQGRDGTLYGAGAFALFKLDTDGGNYSVLHTFNTSTEGALGYGLMQAPDGTLYGSLYEAGPTYGGLFKYDTNGAFTMLHSFTNVNEGRNPVGALLLGSDDSLYGTALTGGSNSVGTVFKLGTNGTGFQVLHTFTGADGDTTDPVGSLIEGPGNVLYGTTFGTAAPAIFKVGMDGGNYGILYSFTNGINQGPAGGLVPGPFLNGSGAFYGTTYARSPGGAQAGTVFAMLVNPPASITPVTSQTAGGQTTIFWPTWASGYSLQMATNLSSPNWVTVSNATPVIGVQVTNSSPNVYYRLVWP